MWNILGSAGMLLVDFPEKYGAAQASFEVSQMIQEEMCRLNLHALATGYNIHVNIVALYILNIGNQAQQDHWLPPMVNGEVVTAIAMTEPSAGSDLASIRTSAIK
jgi:alkylation response protein AidB-like acyl-CoA dehydrogenase